MIEWEYKIEKLVANCGAPGPVIGIQRPPDTYKVVEERLNELGKEGWELVEIAPPLPNECGPALLGIYYFKRGKRVGSEETPTSRMKLLGKD